MIEHCVMIIPEIFIELNEVPIFSYSEKRKLKVNCGFYSVQFSITFYNIRLEDAVNFRHYVFFYSGSITTVRADKIN